VLEHNLFEKDNNLPGPSMVGGNVKEGGVEGDGEGNEGKDEDEDNDEEAEDGNQNANAEGAKKVEGVNAMVMNSMMIMQILTWHEVTFLYPLP
jgi:hypothetical protein